MTTAVPTRTQTAGLQCEPAQQDDELAIRRLMRLPMPGRIAVSTPHDPDHRQAMRIAGDLSYEVVVRDAERDHEAVGYGYRAIQQLMINGQPRSVGYLGGLRCDASLRTAIKVLGRCFAFLADTCTADQAPYDLTSVMVDNAVLRRGLEKGLPGLPTYIPIGQMATLTMRTRRARRRVKSTHIATSDRATTQPIYAKYNALANARPAHLPDIMASASYILSAANHAPTGCICLWDQRAVRQVVVSSYCKAIRRTRPAINLGLSLAGKPTLPRAGSRLEMAYASHAGFAPDDVDTAVALVAGACSLAASRGIALLSIGLPADAPALKPLIKRFRPWVTKSVIYAVTRDPAGIDLDSRPVWMEIATL